jgi:cyanophycinase-like exopeptidase
VTAPTAPHLELAVEAKLLVLVGGGEFSFGETREIDAYLLSKMPADRRTIAFLPTASGSAEYAKHFGTYIAGMDPTVSVINIPIYRGRDARRQKSLDQILAAGLIYLGGGVTTNLLETLRESPADLAIRGAAASGAVVAAIGAAASCFGAQARDMRGSASALPALGWLTDTVVETSFDPDNDTTLRRLMSLPEIALGVGIPAQTALAIHADGSSEIVGEGRIAVFRKSR